MYSKDTFKDKILSAIFKKARVLFFCHANALGSPAFAQMKSKLNEKGIYVKLIKPASSKFLMPAEHRGFFSFYLKGPTVLIYSYKDLPLKCFFDILLGTEGLILLAGVYRNIFLNRKRIELLSKDIDIDPKLNISSFLKQESVFLNSRLNTISSNFLRLLSNGNNWRV